MNTPTNTKVTGRIGTPKIPSSSVTSPFTLSPFTSESNTNLHQRLDTLLKQILTWHEKWHAAHRRGLSLCVSIEAIKRRAIDQKEKDKNTDLYPIEELQVHCKNLAVIMTIFEDVISNIKLYEKQLEALSQLTEARDRIFFKTWNVTRFLDIVQTLSNAYVKEFGLKTIVKENIAHGTTKSELAWHSSVWQYPVYLNSDVEILIKCLKLEIS